MKKFLFLAALVFAFNTAKADDICNADGCCPDPVECAANGGSFGPGGTGGGLGTGPGAPGGGPGPSSVPIDGGLSLLLASSAIIGARRVWQKRKAA